MSTMRIARSVLIMAVVGAVVSAQQVSSESVFDSRNSAGLQTHAAGSRSLFPAFPAQEDSVRLGTIPAGADTVEAFDVEFEDDKEPGITKQLVMFAIITAIVGYAVIELLQSDDAEQTSEPPGKDPPVVTSGTLISIPFPRSR